MDTGTKINLGLLVVAALAAAAAFWQAYEARASRRASASDAVQARADAIETRQAAEDVRVRVEALEARLDELAIDGLDPVAELANAQVEERSFDEFKDAVVDRMRRTMALWRLTCARQGDHGMTQWNAENRTGADAFNVRAVPDDPERILQYPSAQASVPAWGSFSFIDAPTFGASGSGVAIVWNDADGKEHVYEARLER